VGVGIDRKRNEKILRVMKAMESVPSTIGWDDNAVLRRVNPD
jgi:hypothetical protein